MADKKYDGMVYFTVNKPSQDKFEEIKYYGMMNGLKEISFSYYAGSCIIKTNATGIPKINIENFEATLKVGDIAERIKDISAVLGE